MLNTTSAEYDLQSVYNCISYVGVTTELPQVFLAIYDTTPSPYPCTGSEHIDITDNQISLHVPLKVNGEVVLSPRNYDGAVFEFISCTGMLAFLQNSSHGGAPIAKFYSSTKLCTCHCGCQIPNMYNKTYVDILIAGIVLTILIQKQK